MITGYVIEQVTFVTEPEITLKIFSSQKVKIVRLIK